MQLNVCFEFSFFFFLDYLFGNLYDSDAIEINGEFLFLLAWNRAFNSRGVFVCVSTIFEIYRILKRKFKKKKTKYCFKLIFFQVKNSKKRHRIVIKIVFCSLVWI